MGESAKKIHNVKIDENVCIGCGMCASLYPDIFEFDTATQRSHAKEGAETHPDEILFEAAESCPVSGIYLYDESGNQLFPKVS